jgi:hypothetical protein
MAFAIFALGAVTGHAVSSAQKIGSEPIVSQISALDLTMNAGNLPVQTADAI